MLFAGLLSAQPEWLEAEGSKPEWQQRVVFFLCAFCHMFVVDTNLAHFLVCLSNYFCDLFVDDFCGFKF